MFDFRRVFLLSRAMRLRCKYLGGSWFVPWKSKRRIDILAPILLEMWNDPNIGDAHFARAMKRELEKLGYSVRIIPYQLWNARTNAYYVVHVRGMLAYKGRRRPGVKYLMWVISHPNLLTKEECDAYDYVAFASERLAERFAEITTARVGVLLQATDEVSMNGEFSAEKAHELLFVGNTRGVYREAVKNLLPTKYDLAIYGRGWEQTPAAKFVVAESVGYKKTGCLYRSAKIVLNDHWKAMAEDGIVSNRCFDVLAASGFVISDYVPEIDKLFEKSIPMFRKRDELQALVAYYLENDEERHKLSLRGRTIVLRQHTFNYRMSELDMILRSLE